MYLQIGTEDFIKTEDIIGIFDLDNTTVNKETRDYLNEAQKADVVKTVTFDLPKSFIVTEENGQRRVYISALNTATIYKRIEQ